MEKHQSVTYWYKILHLAASRGAEPPQYFEWGGLEYPLAPQKILYPYKFRLKKGLKLCIFRSPNTKFSRGRCPLATPKIVYIYV